MTPSLSPLYKCFNGPCGQSTMLKMVADACVEKVSDIVKQCFEKSKHCMKESCIKKITEGTELIKKNKGQACLLGLYLFLVYKTYTSGSYEKVSFDLENLYKEMPSYLNLANIDFGEVATTIGPQCLYSILAIKAVAPMIHLMLTAMIDDNTSLESMTPTVLRSHFAVAQRTIHCCNTLGGMIPKKIAAVTLGPVVEELAVRYLFQSIVLGSVLDFEGEEGDLKPFIMKALKVATSAYVFSAIHGKMNNDPTGGIGRFLSGLISGYTLESNGSLMQRIAAHSLHNGTLLGKGILVRKLFS